MISTRSKIDTAWENRWASELSSVIQAFPEISAELGLSLLQVDASELERNFSLHHSDLQTALLKSDAVLLTASIVRIRGDLEQARAKVNLAERILNLAGLSGSFRFHFERGLLSLTQGLFLPALEDFFSASRYSEKSLYQLLSLSNALFCLENLGIDAKNVLGQIEELKKDKAIHSHPVYRSNEAQLLAYRMRQAFRKGEVGQALSLVQNQSLLTFDQAEIYSKYIRLLPYTSHFEKLNDQEVSELVSNPRSFFQKGFVIRSLIGQTNVEDQQFIRISDRIDRLYLWTWMWLFDRAQLDSSRLIAAVNDVLTRLDLSTTTREDQLLLRNSLGWIGMIDPAFGTKIRSILAELESLPSAGFDLFQFEWSLINLFQAKKRGQETLFQDTLKSLKQHALWNSNEVLLANLIKEMGTHPIAVKILKGGTVLNEQGQKVTIDLNHFLVIDAKRDTRVISPAICLAMKAFLEHSTMSCCDFAREVFGFYQYDSFVHLPRIHNLLARLRGTFQGLSFRVKGETLLCEGDLSRIDFIQPSDLARELRSESLAPRILVAGSPGSVSRKEIKVARVYEWSSRRERFTRKELEQALGLTRSNASRVLDRMVELGKIEKIGLGKSASYRPVKVMKEAIT